MTASPHAAGLRGWTTPLDAAVAGGIAVWATLEALLVPSSRPLSQLVFALAISLPLVFRRRLPAVVMLLVAGALVLHALTSGPDATFNPLPSLLVATFSVAERIRSVWLALLLGLVPIAAMLAAHVLGYFGTPGIEFAGAVFLFFFVGATWAAGRIVRRRAQSLLIVTETSAEREAEAAASERRRIARELHDIVAHSLSIVALQAAAAEQFVERDPERAKRHLALTRRTAQNALDEMRHLLGVLRDDTETSYSPQPGLSAIAGLIAETEAAGHRCSFVCEVDDDDVTDGAALAVYRIIQESLTNVRRHAARAEVTVTIRQEGREVQVDVINGPGPDRGAGSGRGIPGMAERVRVYGGTLDAGPLPDGGWRVRAAIPAAGAS